MKGKMSIPVRLKLSDMLAPVSGESSRLLMYRKFREGLALSDEEGKLVGARVTTTPSGFATYIDYPNKDPMKEVDVGEIITEVVCGILKPMEDAKELKPELLDLFLWFKPAIDEMRKMEAVPKDG